MPHRSMLKKKIRRGERVNTITRAFENLIGGIVETVSSASTELEASAATLTNTATRSQELTAIVATASEEASTNRSIGGIGHRRNDDFGQ